MSLSKPLQPVYGQGQEPTLEGSSFQALHTGRLWPYLQTVHQSEKACNRTNTSLLGTVENYGFEMLYIIDHWGQYYKTFCGRNLRMFVIS